LCRERRPGHHLPNARASGGLDQLAVHVRHEPHGGDGGQRWIGLHGTNGRERPGPCAIEVEDDERGSARPHAGYRGAGASCDGHGHTEPGRGRLDLRREHQIIEDC